MKEECLICKAPLEYLETDMMMECAICHKKENSKTRCVNGHYVCNSCHTAGMDTIIGLCLTEKSKNPIEIVEKMMALPFCHMHGPEHHVMVGAALLTAYKNAGGNIDLESALGEMMNRGKSVPGGACGFWGACGAGISSGMLYSWIKKYRLKGSEGLARKRGRRPKESAVKENQKPTPLTESEREELIRLRAESARMRTEIAAIKKEIALREEQEKARLKAKKQRLSKNSKTPDTN